MTIGQRRCLYSSLFCIVEDLLKQEFFADIGGEIAEAEGTVKREVLNAFSGYHTVFPAPPIPDTGDFF